MSDDKRRRVHVAFGRRATGRGELQRRARDARRERYTLLAARRVFDVLRGTPFHEDATRVLAKFEQTMNANERKERGALGQYFAYVPDGGTKVYEGKEDLIDAEQTGILYWRKGLGVFAVERFVEAEHLRKRSFEIPADFQIDEVLHGASGVHVGDPANALRVVVEFSAEKAELVAGRVWHPTQELKRAAGGRTRLSFTCTNLLPVVSWALQWGPHVKVIEPSELAAMVLDELERARAQYERPASGIAVSNSVEIERRAAAARSGAPGVAWDEIKSDLLQ